MALFEFKLPDLGEGVMEGELVKWHVKEGDSVKEDQTIAEVMTDKATVTVPSPKAGRVVKTHGKEGEMAKVHQLLFFTCQPSTRDLLLEAAGAARVIEMG